MNRDPDEKTLSTADLVAATDAQQRDANRDARRPATADQTAAPNTAEEPLVALFTPEVADDFRTRWDAIQRGFVDDPQQAVRQADELVANVMKSLAESFANARANIESQVSTTDTASTENLRVALRRYRSFFQRLLSL